MSKARFGAVKELIDEKKYAEARLLLKTINHPAARDLEDVIDELDPPSLSSFLAREPISASERASYLRKLAFFFGVILFLGLAAYMLGVFSPHLTKFQIEQATQVAHNSARDATLTAITPTLRPTITPSPTATPITPTPQPTVNLSPVPASVFYAKNEFVLRSCPERKCPAGQMVRSGEAVVVIGIARGGSIWPSTVREWYKIQPSDPSQTDDEYGYSAYLKVAPEYAAAIASPTWTPYWRTKTPDPNTTVPTATRVYTPMPPSTYYVMGPYDSFLRLCPDHSCKTGARLPVGAPVVVVGVEVGEYSVTTGKLWYKIQITDGSRISYQYDYAERFGTAPPTARPTLTYGPSPSPRPTFTPGGPSQTPRPTPTRHP